MGKFVKVSFSVITAQTIWDKMISKLDEHQQMNYLCFIFGYMQSKMTDKDLEILNDYLDRKIAKTI